MSEDKFNLLEESAFEQSGLSSDGCLENLDDYARQSIKRYGRLLLKNYIENVVYDQELT